MKIAGQGTWLRISWLNSWLVHRVSQWCNNYYVYARAERRYVAGVVCIYIHMDLIFPPTYIRGLFPIIILPFQFQVVLDPFHAGYIAVSWVGAGEKGGMKCGLSICIYFYVSVYSILCVQNLDQAEMLSILPYYYYFMPFTFSWQADFGPVCVSCHAFSMVKTKKGFSETANFSLGYENHCGWCNMLVKICFTPFENYFITKALHLSLCLAFW